MTVLVVAHLTGKFLPAGCNRRHPFAQQRCSARQYRRPAGKVTCKASKDDELQLVKTEKQADGTVLFVFGTETEVKQSKSEAPTKPEPEEPEPEPEPAQQAQSSKADQEASEVASDSAAASSNGAVPMNRDALSNLKVVELRELCKENNIKGYSKYKKDELIAVLLGELVA
ncbi:hypothetical protein WJX72_011948 [[Myrmecia] bisecta]|uniref:Rho termination factor-like N-terminal domain-containing protein n=1 Tax=[Myrmecia] bisecta TaxID=41462 RepID=A0AAW1R8Z5_9CHLO